MASQHSFWQARVWAAKASLISTWSTWPSEMPAFSSITAGQETKFNFSFGQYYTFFHYGVNPRKESNRPGKNIKMGK
jgi:hypothetical protein